eukprot:TRINITY_DN91488_c0_g1_i1.p1 TRINITY_DN91488_c0_g1~~TRINITY_DN91488_c0_g1_i1.p1  ORF type:complete len:605 (-),score=158.84 TRINITY_DN91488_c0_g1_i1:21-1835(-)
MAAQATRRAGGTLPPCGFLVYAEKAGQLPLLTERRAKGKRVTIVSGVKGNARALCTALTSLLGVGGTVHSKGPLSDVEVQGEQVERVEQALWQLDCVRGPGAKAPPAAVVERDCGYDDFLRQDVTSSRRKERRAAVAAEAQEPPEPPADAPCRKWHGRWIYCSGNCSKVDFTGLWLDLSGRDDFLPLAGGGQGCRGDAEAALQSLGMSAQVGKAVESYRTELAADAARRAAPKASLCAPRAQGAPAEDASLTCPECGAVFNMKRTLDLHMRNHRRERECPTSVEQGLSELPSWRQASYAQQQREECVEGYTPPHSTDVWFEDQGNDVAVEEQLSEEAAQYLSSRASGSGGPSLASWIDAAVASRPARRKRGLAGGGLVPCPVCSQSFPEEEINEHIDLCLAIGVDEPLQEEDVSQEVDGELPGELLESLLQLQLPPDATEHFWASYEQRTAMMGAQEAFLAALEEILTRQASSGESASSSRSAGSDHAVARAPALMVCPVCQVEHPAALIEEHVEACLASKSACEAAAASHLQQAETEAESCKAVPRQETVRRWERSRTAATQETTKTELETDAPPTETAQERLARKKAEAKARKAAAKASGGK